MRIYRGVVRDGAVVLPEEAHLEDGTSVEVRVLHALTNGISEEEAEQRFQRKLLALRMISEIVPPVSTLTDEEFDDFEPIEIEGEPLSEQIIRERGW